MVLRTGHADERILITEVYFMKERKGILLELKMVNSSHILLLNLLTPLRQQKFFVDMS